MGTEGHSCYYFRFEFLFYIFRWSHAERLLAIDQLIDTCEPQQVRHMMQVSLLVSHLFMSPLPCNVTYCTYAVLKNLNTDFLVPVLLHQLNVL